LKNKVLVICKSLFWCFVLLLFPIASGVLSVVLSLDIVETLFLQGTFMLIATAPPVLLVLNGKWNFSEIGLTRLDFENSKKRLFFSPVLVIFIPVAMQGFYVKSMSYVLGSLFLYLFVGISEEIYFRGIIPHYLKKEFSTKATILLSALIFGVGHMATAFTGSCLFEIALTMLNAFIFGWLAIELTILSHNIVPAILVHFFFNFETKIVAMSGRDLLIAEGIRGVLMFIIVIWLAIVISKGKKRDLVSLSLSEKLQQGSSRVSHTYQR